MDARTTHDVHPSGRVLSALSFIEGVVGIVAPVVFNTMLDYTTGIGLFWCIAGIILACALLLSCVKTRGGLKHEICVFNDGGDIHTSGDAVVADVERQGLLEVVENIYEDEKNNQAI